MMEGAVALVMRQDGASEPTAQLTVFTDDSYPSGVLAIDGMMRIIEVDLAMLMEFFEAVKAKGKIVKGHGKTCRCISGTHN
jgi:hypothetical protein